MCLSVFITFWHVLSAGTCWNSVLNTYLHQFSPRYSIIFTLHTVSEIVQFRGPWLLQLTRRASNDTCSYWHHIPGSHYLHYLQWVLVLHASTLCMHVLLLSSLDPGGEWKHCFVLITWIFPYCLLPLLLLSKPSPLLYINHSRPVHCFRS